MATIDKGYFLCFVVLLILEILIALFIKDKFIRPFFGDFLVVILIYSFIRSFFPYPVITTAFGVLLFSYLVEVSQYFKLVNILGLEGNTWASVIIGTSFSWWDMLFYTLGILFVLFAEHIRNGIFSFHSQKTCLLYTSPSPRD